MVFIEQRGKLTVPASGKVFVDSALSGWAGKAMANREKRKCADWPVDFWDKLFKLAYGAKWSCGFDLPCIVTGHQANWHSIGVWIKTVMAAKLAKKVNGFAVQLVLDHDIYDSALRLPVENEMGLQKKEIVVENDGQGIPIECRKVREDFSEFLEVMKNYVSESIFAEIACDWNVANGSVSETITSVMSAVNKRLGLDNILYVPVSKLSEQPEFLKFVVNCLSDPQRFAEYYNHAVERHSINSIPKLKISDDIELPFWLFLQDGVRLKLFVRLVTGNKVEICAGSEKLGKINLDGMLAWQQLRNILAFKNYKLRPCAVTLTAFSRLYFADLFIHGIGGQRYEAVTDYLLKKFFGLEKTCFVSATGTVNLPLAYEIKKPALNQAQIKRRLRAIKFNPENFIDKPFCELPVILKMVEKKRSLLKSLVCEEMDSKAKKEIYLRISEYNKRLSFYTKNSVLEIQELSQKVDCYERDFEIASSRKYFFGLYSKQMLKEIMQDIIF